MTLAYILGGIAILGAAMVVSRWLTLRQVAGMAKKLGESNASLEAQAIAIARAVEADEAGALPRLRGDDLIARMRSLRRRDPPASSSDS